jgi:E3 ubiquitin-protein ligase DOA10
MCPSAWFGVAFGILIILGGLYALASRYRKKLRRVGRFLMMKEKPERQALQRQERAQERELDELGSDTGRRRTVDVQNDLEANNQANGPTVEFTDSRNPPSRSGSGEAGSSSDKTEVNKTESESDQDRPSEESSTVVQGGKKISFPRCTWSSAGFLY